MPADDTNGSDARDLRQIRPCGSGDVTVTVIWERNGTALVGQVIAENISGRPCRLPGKPEVTPLRPDGTPLPTQTIVTAELMGPGYVIVPPGGRAAARVAWSSWCGQQASQRARISWDGGSAVAEVRGPAQPACERATPDNLTTSWFKLID